MKICKKCFQEFMTYIRVDDRLISMSNRSYCFSCSPYKGKQETSVARLDKYMTLDGANHKWCNAQKHWQPLSEFYTQKRGGLQAYCKSCQKTRTHSRIIELKQKCVTYKEDICFDCREKFPHYIYDFHHLDPKEKDFKISSLKSLSMPWTKLKAELDKCVLLCAHCHRHRHHSANSIEDGGPSD